MELYCSCSTYTDNKEGVNLDKIGMDEDSQKIIDLQLILSSTGVSGWKTERARANSSNSSPLVSLVSNKSNT